jgi:hypothetical protein
MFGEAQQEPGVGRPPPSLCLAASGSLPATQKQRCMVMPINGSNQLYVDCNDLFIEYKSCFHQVLGEMPVP